MSVVHYFNQFVVITFQEFEVLWPSLDFVFDKGTLGSSPINKQGSTVVDLSKRGQYTIIREGWYDSIPSLILTASLSLLPVMPL